MILLDTHTVLWLGKEPGKLSETAVRAIQEARQLDGLAIADKTLWEIAFLSSRNRITLRAPLRLTLERIQSRFHVLPITAEIAQLSVAFSSNFPGDPSDRLIAATALAHHIPLITADSAIRRSGEVPTIW